MNIYCSTCKKELEIEKDLGSEIHVFGHECKSEPEKKVEKKIRRRKTKPDYFNPRDVAILGGDPSL